MLLGHSFVGVSGQELGFIANSDLKNSEQCTVVWNRGRSDDLSRVMPQTRALSVGATTLSSRTAGQITAD